MTRDRNGQRALRWALRTARVSDAVLILITAYEPRPCVTTMYSSAYADARDAAAAARFLQDEALRDVSDEPTLRVALRRVVRGDPVGVLVAASANADLLVVGRRARRLRGLRFTSVSRGCANRAMCPVVIVRGDQRRRSQPAVGVVARQPRLIETEGSLRRGRPRSDPRGHRLRRARIEVRRDRH